MYTLTEQTPRRADRQRWGWLLSGAAAVLVITGACAGSRPAHAADTGPTGANWTKPSGNDYNWRYSRLNQINVHNARQLQVSWTMSTGVLRGHEGQPLVIGNTMYF